MVITVLLHTHVGEGRLPFILKRVPSNGERPETEAKEETALFNQTRTAMRWGNSQRNAAALSLKHNKKEIHITLFTYP